MKYRNSLSTHSGKVGKQGEDFACSYLADNGYRIVDRNFRTSAGELDIVCLSETKNGRKFHFVEVKTSSSAIRPEENMHLTKIRKVAKMAEIYMKMLVSRGTVSCETPFSVDFVGVRLRNDDSLLSITHLRDLEM